MKANPDKCHFLLSKNFETNINENRNSNTRFEKLLGVTLDNQTLITTFPKFVKQPVINFMHSLEFPTTSIIRIFYLRLITVPL